MRKNGDLDGVVSALDAGADINIQNNDGLTALIWAARNGHIEIVESLLRANANLNT